VGVPTGVTVKDAVTMGTIYPNGILFSSFFRQNGGILRTKLPILGYNFLRILLFPEKG
jgi:hypothetical protein